MNKTIRRLVRSFAGVLLAAAIVIGAAAGGPAHAEEYRASHIQRIDGNLKVDYSQYLDGDVMFRLPDTVKPDQEISVIVTLDEANLMDAYNRGIRTMSFREFALESGRLTGSVRRSPHGRRRSWRHWKKRKSLMSWVRIMIPSLPALS